MPEWFISWFRATDWEAAGTWATGVALAAFAYFTYMLTKQQQAFQYMPPLFVVPQQLAFTGVVSYTSIGYREAGVHCSLELINPGVNPIVVTDIYLDVVSLSEPARRKRVPPGDRIMDWPGQQLCVLRGGEHVSVKLGTSCAELRNWMEKIGGRKSDERDYCTANLEVLIGYHVSKAKHTKWRTEAMQFEVDRATSLGRWVVVATGLFDLPDSFRLGSRLTK